MTSGLAIRVVGCDPGTSSLDLLLLENGAVHDQAQLVGVQPERVIEILSAWRPLNLIAGPSGYGLPLVRVESLTDDDIGAMSLVRPDELGGDVGIGGFRSLLKAFAASDLPVVFLPGGRHLRSIPSHRKANAIDLGTADKVAVAALALRSHAGRFRRPLGESTFALVEVGSAFTAVLVVSRGRIVDTSAGTRGPIGLRCGGVWDGEVAYQKGLLSKNDLFRGGWRDLGPLASDAFRESLRRHVAGLQAVTPFETVWISGAGLEIAEVLSAVHAALDGLATIVELPHLPGSRVKHAAEGAALIADGLAGGRHADLVESLELT